MHAPAIGTQYHLISSRSASLDRKGLVMAESGGVGRRVRPPSEAGRAILLGERVEGARPGRSVRGKPIFFLRRESCFAGRCVLVGEGRKHELGRSGTGKRLPAWLLPRVIEAVRTFSGISSSPGVGDRKSDIPSRPASRRSTIGHSADRERRGFLDSKESVAELRPRASGRCMLTPKSLRAIAYSLLEISSAKIEVDGDGVGGSPFGR